MRRRDLLQLALASAACGLVPRARASSPRLAAPRRLIGVFVTGGWDTCYALDPKEPMYVDVPAGTVQTFGGLDVFCDASRPGVTRFFERHADVSTIVRGICTDAINHNECQRRIATGTREETRPDLGAIVGHDLGRDLPLPYLILGDTAWTGPYAASAGRLGNTNQLVQLLDPPSARVIQPPSLSDGETAFLAQYAQASADRARATRGATGYNRRRVDDFVEGIERAGRLRALRDRLGAPGETVSYQRQLAVALDALAQDLSWATMVSTGLGWDTHGDNQLQGGFHDLTFAGLADLVDELKARPGRAAGTRMIDDTIVLVFSELSRTPRLAGTDEHAGKNHWPVTSALVIGAGVPGARVLGATDPGMGSMPIDLATGAPAADGIRLLYSHFIAGVVARCGVDPSTYFDVPGLDALVG